MPDQELIHAGEDVSAVLSLADELGLVVREDAPSWQARSGGRHNYMVLGAAWRELVRGSTIPPFDFIAGLTLHRNDE